MIDNSYETFLHADPHIKSEKAVASRMSRARKAEEILGSTLDTIVSSDATMHEAMLKLKAHGDTRGNIQNTVRKYYIFKNGKEFPRLRFQE